VRETSDATDTLSSTAHALQAAAPPMPAALSLAASRRQDLGDRSSNAGKIAQQVERQNRSQDEVSQDRESGLEAAADPHRRLPGRIEAL